MRDATPDKQPSKPVMALLALVMVAIGFYMSLHGLGLVDASWLNPNPRTPPWVFIAIGLFVQLSGVLMANHVVSLPGRLIHTLGWATIGLAVIMANWLVFFAEGTSCGVEQGGLALQGLGLACRGVAVAVVILFDLILLAVVFGRRPNSSAKS